MSYEVQDSTNEREILSQTPTFRQKCIGALALFKPTSPFYTELRDLATIVTQAEGATREEYLAAYDPSDNDTSPAAGVPLI